MKKYLMIIAAALAFAACQKEAAVKDEPVNEDLNTFTFTAVVDDNVVDADTKATVSRGGVFAWAKDDELAFYDTEGNKYDAVVTAVDGSGVATIEVTATGTPTFYSAIYPAAVAVAKDRIALTGAAKGPVVIAEVGSGELTFHHMGSILNIKINDIPTGTQSLQIVPTASISWAGGKFTFDAGVPDFSGVSAPFCPVVPVTVADDGIDISVPMLSANYTGGFEIFLMNNEGRNLYRKATTKNYDLTGTKLLNMKALTYERPNPKSIKLTTSSTSGWWDVTDAQLIQTSDNTFELSINTDPSTTYNIYDEYNVAALSGTINGSESVTSSYLSIYGNIVDSWDASDATAMYQVNGIQYIRNAVLPNSGDGNSYYRFHSDSNELAVWGSNVSVPVHTATNAYWGTGGDMKALYTPAGTYNIYVYDDGVSNGKKVIAEEPGVDDRVSHMTLISYDVSTGVATITDKGIAKAAIAQNTTFYNDNIALPGSFNSWNASNVMTYNGNHLWSSTLDISSEGDYTFKIIAKSNYAFQWPNQYNTTYPGTTLYGSANHYSSEGYYNMTVHLDAGKYTVYANDYTWDSNKMKFSFVKQ